MTVHVLAFPHTELSREFESCAFTARTRVFASMLAGAGIPVVTYAGERSEAAAPNVTITRRKERRAWWPWYKPDGQHVFNDFDPGVPGWRAYNDRVAAELRRRAQPGDVVAVTMGTSHRPALEAVGDLGLTVVETGVGYSGVWAPFRVFESWAWRHFLSARNGETDDVRFFDEVIPRAYELVDFPAGPGSGGFVLYLGRLMARKGPHIAAEAALRAGVPLKVAGQGARSWSRSLIVCADGTELRGDVEYLGILKPAERAAVMGDAIAVLTPTMYLEPFGGVSVEAQLTGTPAIVSDWGGLTENVIDGETGFRCRLLAEFASAISRASSLDRSRIREHAIATWSTEAIAPRFLAYLARLATLHGEGWYAAA